MTENETKLNKTEQKEKIRKRYGANNSYEVNLIPALPKNDVFDEDKEQRVAVYARVSTDDPRQTSSFELQKNHYVGVIDRHQNWKLANVYADEGISGTSLNKRDQFIKMMNDCVEGKIDLIVTKSVSRFARNLIDCVECVNRLRKLDPPVGVIFETEGIFTLDPSSEMLLKLMATMAEEESHNKSEIMNVSIEMRFRDGKYLTPPLLGYDIDEDNQLVINQDEAKVVRLIFFMYLYGYTCSQIAAELTKLNYKTKKGNTNWSPGSVLGILQNERHCGDVLARKTWTPDFHDHRSRKNRHDRNQYFSENHHEAIVSRDDFLAVQRLINNAKYGYKGFLPELHVVKNGVLKGFVTIHPKWAGFLAEDYTRASFGAYNSSEDDTSSLSDGTPKHGEFDLRGYEIARSQFFDTVDKLSVTISLKNISFSTYCVRKMDNIQYIELLVNVRDGLLAIRKTNKENRCAIRWAAHKEKGFLPIRASGVAFLSNIYKLFSWNEKCQYRLRGVFRQNDGESVIVFNVNEPEIFIPNSVLCSESGGNQANTNEFNSIVSTPKSVCAYPAEWVDGFGNNFYRHAQAKEIYAFVQSGKWELGAESEVCESCDLKVTSLTEMRSVINSAIGKENDDE